MTSISDDVIREAVTAYPELQRLLDLDAVGWRWMAPPLDEEGHPVEVHGLRWWTSGPPDVDAIRIRSSTDVIAIRMEHSGGLLWEETGTLEDVVDKLLALPPPGSPYAPRLVIGRSPQLTRWVT